MSTKISLILKAGGERYKEEDFLSKVKDLSPYFEKQADIEGLIHIEFDNQRLEIDDDLGYNIFHLALKGSISLIESGNMEMNYSAFEGKIVLTVVDDYITFQGDFIQGNIFPKKEFLIELIDCGRRYIHLLKSIEPPGRYNYLLEELNPILEKAEQLHNEKGHH